MSLRPALVACAVMALVFLLLDAAWLTTMAERLYRPAIGHLMMPRFAPLPALLFYLIYLVGLATLAVMPALAAGDWVVALRRGALLGFVAYATYDLTNQATLRDWPWSVTLADLAWGSFVSAAAAAAGARAGVWAGNA